ncbi:hypothetical protein Tco_0494114 [Tanacetum coccineum]
MLATGRYANGDHGYYDTLIQDKWCCYGKCILQRCKPAWLAETDEELYEQELEAHYSYMAKIQEVPNADSGTDSEPLEKVQYDTNDNVDDLNDVECDDERVELVIYYNLKLRVDENKRIQKQLRRANATLTQE